MSVITTFNGDKKVNPVVKFQMMANCLLHELDSYCTGYLILTCCFCDQSPSSERRQKKWVRRMFVRQPRSEELAREMP